jgi:hypothetical protein
MIEVFFSLFYLLNVATLPQNEIMESEEVVDVALDWIDRITIMNPGDCALNEGVFMDREAAEGLIITLERHSGEAQSIECQLKLNVLEAELNYQIRNYRLDYETASAENALIRSENEALLEELEVSRKNNHNRLYLGMIIGAASASAIIITAYSVGR